MVNMLAVCMRAPAGVQIAKAAAQEDNVAAAQEVVLRIPALANYRAAQGDPQLLETLADSGWIISGAALLAHVQLYGPILHVSSLGASSCTWHIRLSRGSSVLISLSRQILFGTGPDLRCSFLLRSGGSRDATLNDALLAAEENVQHVAESLL